jgi:hypothetical protein
MQTTTIDHDQLADLIEQHNAHPEPAAGFALYRLSDGSLVSTSPCARGALLVQP